MELLDFLAGFLVGSTLTKPTKRLMRVYHARMCVVHPQDLHPMLTENCPKCDRIMKTISLIPRRTVHRNRVKKIKEEMDD